jgi:xanthine dehydrogenase YagR molybdenum-binding subunit
MSNAAYPDRARIDARDKVLGKTAFAADVALPNLLHAMMVPARIAKGVMTVISTEEAMKVPGVVRILTPADFTMPVPAARYPQTVGPPTLQTQIAYRGQPVALVIAESLEAAIEAAARVRATYTEEPFAAKRDRPGAVREDGEGLKAGDAEKAMTGAKTTIAADYESPSQHHNPIELISTTAIWSGGRLTIYEGTQHSGGVKAAVARTLGLDPAIVDVKSAWIGGGFGQKGWVQRQTAIVARAAMLTGRPVKLVSPRGQLFHVATHRPQSTHKIKLGADGAGKMVAAVYDSDQQQSRRGFYQSNYHEGTVRLYGIENYLGTGANIRLDIQNPGHMRAPHEHPACFAFDSAVDELAYATKADPVAFRIANDGKVDPATGHPYSSRFLNECLIEGAKRFGWNKRTPAPGSMTAKDGTQIGWGVGCGVYPASVSATIATLRITADGKTRLAVSGHEMGQGIRNTIAAMLIDQLKIDPINLEIAIGDTTAAPQHLTAGSWGTFSVVPVSAKAVVEMQRAVAELMAGRKIAGNLHQQLAAVKRPFLQVEVSQLGPGQDAKALDLLRSGGYALAGPDYPAFTTMSYIAHFVEVRVEPRTRRIRMPRVVSIADCGLVISPRTAASQIRGGVVWGFSAALREESEVDPRYGGYLNNDLADYVIAVNSDIGDIDVGFVNQPDPLANTIGVKGLGEVAMAGAAAGIANAVFHATGKRLRKLPIRIEDLL